MVNFFQSPSWARFQGALGEQVIEMQGSGWRFWGRTVRDRLGTYLYLPYGPVVENDAALDEAVRNAKNAARDIGAYRVIAEPSLPITQKDAERVFSRQLFGFQPSRTQVIDLRRESAQILADMSATRRKQWRSAERKGMTFFESSDRKDFDEGVRLLQLSAEKKSFAVRDDNFFELFWAHLVQPGIAKVFVAKLQADTHVVAFVVDDTDTRYYLYVGRDLSNNSLQVSSPFLTHMILDAKQRGLKYFDLCGISARDDVVDEMTGFTNFKRTFGGETVQFAGTWDIGVRFLTYALRQTLDLGRSRPKKNMSAGQSSLNSEGQEELRK